LGYRRCRVYPFNPDATDCSISIVNPEASLQLAHTHSDSESHDENFSKENQEPSVILSSDRLALFQQILREGYNIPYEEYIKRLQENHPKMFMVVR